LGGIQNGHLITLLWLVRTAGTADEVDLLRGLLERCNTANTESNRSIMANAFRQGWIDGTRHQRWAEIGALRYPKRAPAFAATLDLMELHSDRPA
jgi:hypothetical protein